MAISQSNASVMLCDFCPVKQWPPSGLRLFDDSLDEKPDRFFRILLPLVANKTLSTFAATTSI